MEKPSSAWWLVPLFFGIIGGLIAYVGVKDEDEDFAYALLGAGIAITVLAILMVMIYFFFANVPIVPPLQP